MKSGGFVFFVLTFHGYKHQTKKLHFLDILPLTRIMSLYNTNEVYNFTFSIISLIIYHSKKIILTLRQDELFRVKICFKSL